MDVENMNVMDKTEFNIYVGLVGGFGGSRYYSTILADNKEEALEYAYQLAREEYEMYEGSHGLMTWEDCAEELGFDCDDELTDKDEETISERYNEEVESWITYKVVATSEDSEISEDELVREHYLC